MKKFSICQRNKNQGSKIWYLREFDTDSHKIKYKSLNTTKKYEAEKALEHTKQKIYLNPNIEKIESLPHLQNLANQWLDYTSNANRQTTFISYNCWIKIFLNFCKQNNITRFNEFTSIHAHRIINENQDLKQSSRHNERAVLRTFFNWIISTYDIEHKNVFSRIKMPKTASHKNEFWTMEQIKNILDNETNENIRMCFAFMAYAGLRINETLNLKWQNITDSTLEIINGKGGKNAILPISKLLKNEIEKFKKNHQNKTEKILKVNKQTAREHLFKICTKLDLDGFKNPHKFRHSFASNLLRNGANIIAVSKLMRHTNPSMTLNIYSHVLPSDLNQTLELLDK